MLLLLLLLLMLLVLLLLLLLLLCCYCCCCYCLCYYCYCCCCAATAAAVIACATTAVKFLFALSYHVVAQPKRSRALLGVQLRLHVSYTNERAFLRVFSLSANVQLSFILKLHSTLPLRFPRAKDKTSLALRASTQALRFPSRSQRRPELL